MTWTEEGGGHVATCPCGWLRWETDKGTLGPIADKHHKACKKVSAE